MKAICYLCYFPGSLRNRVIVCGICNIGFLPQNEDSRWECVFIIHVEEGREVSSMDS